MDTVEAFSDNGDSQLINTTKQVISRAIHLTLPALFSLYERPVREKAKTGPDGLLKNGLRFDIWLTVICGYKDSFATFKDVVWYNSYDLTRPVFCYCFWC